MIRKTFKAFPTSSTNWVNAWRYPKIENAELLFGKQEHPVVHGIQTHLLHLQKVKHIMGTMDYKLQLAEIKRKINYGLTVATATDLSKHTNPDLRIHGIGTKISLRDAQAKIDAKHEKLTLAVAFQSMNPQERVLFLKQLKFLKRVVTDIEKQKTLKLNRL
ncbi:MAG: hypothetical protein WC462_03520 [archaeon]